MSSDNGSLTVTLPPTVVEVWLQFGCLEETAASRCASLFREMYRVTEGLQREKQSLMKQLDLLRYDYGGLTQGPKKTPNLSLNPTFHFPER